MKTLTKTGATQAVLIDHARHHTRRRHQPARAVVRFLAGRDVDGQRRTDARWAQAGATANTPHGYASRWAHYSHRRRSLIRVLTVTAAVLIIYGYATNMTSTAATLRVVAWLAILTGGWAVVEKCRRWSHVQTYIVRPGAALADMLGIPRRTDPRVWVHVPTDHRINPDKQVTIDLLGGYTATQAQQKHHAAVAMKLFRMDHPNWGINFEGPHPVMWFRACPQPPELVVFEQVRELAEQTPEGEFLLGLGSRMAPFAMSLAGDSPHVLASIGSGGGKSNFGKWMALQALRRGSRVVVIDVVKRGASHKWAKGVPGVEIHRTPASAHAALLELTDLVETRCESYWHHGATGADQQILLIIEESNRTLRKLQSYWVNELAGKKTSEAILGIEAILCVGREAGVNAVTVGQRMSAAASGGGDARENYGVRLGNRFSRQTARMLFGDCNPLPQNVTDPGLVQVVIGQTATQVKLPKLPDDDPTPIQWALAGTAQTPADLGESVSDAPRLPGKTPVNEPGSPISARQTRLTVVPAPGQELVSLSQAAIKLEVPRSTLTNARNRDADFPQHCDVNGQALLYRMEALTRWAANRPKAQSGKDHGTGDVS